MATRKLSLLPDVSISTITSAPLMNQAVAQRIGLREQILIYVNGTLIADFRRKSVCRVRSKVTCTLDGIVALGELLVDAVSAEDAHLRSGVMPQDIDIVRNVLAASSSPALSQRFVPVEGDVVSVSANWLADQFMLEGY